MILTVVLLAMLGYIIYIKTKKPEPSSESDVKKRDYMENFEEKEMEIPST